MKRAAVLSISGGLDSTCLLMTLLAKDYEVKAYSFKYGQKHVIELEKVQKNIKFLQDKGFPINHQIIDLTSAFNESASSLSSFSGVEIPEGSYMEEKMKSTVVENRNVIFASILYGKALAWANKEERDVEIFLGIHAGDHAIYPDCRPGFVDAMSKAIAEGTYENLTILAPYTNISKTEIARHGKALGIDYSETWSCYKGGEHHCGKCGTCTERKEALRDAGIQDNTVYED